VITLLVLAGCQNPFNQDETPTGNGSGTATGSVTVSLNVSTDAEGNSIVPDVRSMVAEYRLEMSRDGMDPHAAGVAAADAEGGVSFSDLAVGDWQLQVEAVDAENTVIARGDTTVTVEADGAETVTVTVRPTQAGEGRVELRVTWPAGEIDGLQGATLTPTGGDATDILDDVRLIDGSSGVEYSATLSSGGYHVKLLFTRGGTQVATILKTLHVFDSVTTADTLELTASRIGQEPATARDLTGAPAGSDSIELSWTDAADTEEGFRILRSSDDWSSQQSVQIAADARSYIDRGLTAGVTYRYRIVAYNDYGDAVNPPEIAVTMVPPPSAPLLAAEDDTGASDADNTTMRSTGLSLSGTAQEGGSVELTSSRDGALATTEVDADGAWSAEVSLSEGAHEITARATAAGPNGAGDARSVPSDPTTITVDTTAPQVPTIDAPAPGSYAPGQELLLGGLETAATVKYSVNNGAAWLDYTPPVVLEAADSGDAVAYYLSAYQTDRAGNRSRNAATVVVHIDPSGDGPTAPLLITEVGSVPYTNISAWIEVYNPGANPVDLGEYTLRSPARLRSDPYTAASAARFPLPSLEVPPGGYAVIRGRIEDDYVTGPRTAYVVNTDEQVPNWVTGNGFIELVQGESTVDFVRFGIESEAPTSSGAWSGGNVPAMQNDAYGKSISRAGSNADTDGADDWSAQDFATPGAPNDVAGTTDGDGDGIPDANERAGTTFAGLPLHAWGAREDVPDIFVHIDYMDSSDPGVVPRERALDAVVDAFADEGYALHIDVGDLFHQTPGPAPDRYDLSDDSHRVPFAQSLTLGAEPGYANLYAYKYRHMPIARKQVFHYSLFGYSQEPDGSSGPSGKAELNGNDLMVTLGNYGLSTADERERNLLDNWQAAVFMHELGHNLGLRHGGDENENYKPNYFSIMNYLYSLTFLPDIGTADDEGDRYYYEYYAELDLPEYRYIDSLHKNPYDYPPGEVNMDFSHGRGAHIDENAVLESEGIGQPGGAGVDFNADGDSTDALGALNLNPLWGSGISVIDDYDDWANLELFFGRSFGGDTSGVSVQSTRSTPGAAPLMSDPVWNDRQQAYPEEPPPERLRDWLERRR